jgi:multicomponent Na+:H+ antiporter subunit G
MIEFQYTTSIILVVLGIIFMLSGSVGMLRLPDFYTRSHAVSMSDMLGIIFVITGLIIYEGFTQSGGKLLLIILFIALANPVGTHALARAAYRQGVKPLFNEPSDEDSNL